MLGHAIHHALRTFERHLFDLLAVHVEDDAPKAGCTSVIQVDHGTRGTSSRFNSALDEFGASLSERNDSDVIWNQLVVDQLAYKIKIRLRRRRKSNLDLFEADLNQQFKKPQLALNTHGFDERLIAITQVGTHPNGRMCNFFCRPGAL